MKPTFLKRNQKVDCSRYARRANVEGHAHQFVVVVHEVVVHGVLGGILCLGAEDPLHVIRAAPSSSRCVNAWNVVQDEWLLSALGHIPEATEALQSEVFNHHGKTKWYIRTRSIGCGKCNASFIYNYSLHRQHDLRELRVAERPVRRGVI